MMTKAIENTLCKPLDTKKYKANNDVLYPT